MRKQIIGGFAIVAFMVSAGCSDDSGDSDLAAYCRLSAEADTQEDIPGDDELDEIVDAAPAEIRDDVETLVNAIKSIEDPDDPESFGVFEEPDVVEASANVEAFEDENCDTESDGDSDGDEDGDETTTTTEPEDEETTTTTEVEETTTTTTSG